MGREVQATAAFGAAVEASCYSGCHILMKTLLPTERDIIQVAAI